MEARMGTGSKEERKGYYGEEGCAGRGTFLAGQGKTRLLKILQARASARKPHSAERCNKNDKTCFTLGGPPSPREAYFSCPNFLKTKTKEKTYREHPQRAIPETFDLSDI